jgi:hypothetical protein
MRAALVTALLLVATTASAQERPLVDGAVGLGGVSRHLSYHQDVFGRFAPYNLTVAPSVLFRGEVYLFAATPLKALQDLGIVGGAELVFGATSQGPDGRSRDTSFTSTEAGLRYRFPYASGEVGVSARWMLQRFVIGPGSASDAAIVPAISYQSVRPGVDLQHRVSARVRLLAGFGWLFVLDAGELTERYFPRATIHAADATVGAAVAVTGPLELRVVLGARRYFHDMRVEPGDAYLAGGAVDQVFTGSLTAAWRR